MGFTVPNSFPPPYAYGYLNNKSVQKELGVKVNYTQSSNIIANSKRSTLRIALDGLDLRTDVT